MNAEPTTRAAQDLPGWTTVVDSDGRPVALVRERKLAEEVVRALQTEVAPGDARRCAGCGALSAVIDSRAHRSGSVRRRRRCDACGVAWTTFESRARPAHSDDA